MTYKVNVKKQLKLIKFYTSIILAISIFIIIASSCTQKKIYKDGEYYGESEGYYSNIKVKVTVKNGSISDVEIIEHQEPEILATVVFDNLPDEIIKKNSAEVDVIAGATFTSKSFLKAVNIALDESRIID